MVQKHDRAEGVASKRCSCMNFGTRRKGIPPQKGGKNISQRGGDYVLWFARPVQRGEMAQQHPLIQGPEERNPTGERKMKVQEKHPIIWGGRVEGTADAVWAGAQLALRCLHT